MKRVLSFILVMALFVSFAGTAYASSNNDPTIIKDTNEERVVELWDGETCYRTTYNKIDQTLCTMVFKNSECVDFFVIDIAQTEIEDAGLVAISTVVPTQSETGFGYLEGTSISSYACSEELYENGTYEYHGINLYNTSIPDTQANFRNKVNELISLENQLKGYTGVTTFLTVVTVILYCFGNLAATSANITALGLAANAEVKAIQAAEVANDCGVIYSQLFQYRIV